MKSLIATAPALVVRATTALLGPGGQVTSASPGCTLAVATAGEPSSTCATMFLDPGGTTRQYTPVGKVAATATFLEFAASTVPSALIRPNASAVPEAPVSPLSPFGPAGSWPGAKSFA